MTYKTVATTTNKKTKNSADSLRQFVRETPEESYGQTVTLEQHKALCNWLPQKESTDALSDF